MTVLNVSEFGTVLFSFFSFFFVLLVAKMNSALILLLLEKYFIIHRHLQETELFLAFTFFVQSLNNILVFSLLLKSHQNNKLDHYLLDVSQMILN